MSIQVRFATPGDVSTLLQVGEAFIRETHYREHTVDKAVFRQKVETLVAAGDNNATCVIVATNAQNTMLGFIHGGIDELIFSHQRIASEIFFYVIPQARGGFAGLRLLTAFREWAKNRNACEIRVHTAADIFPARFRQMLLKLGFKPFGENFSHRL